MKRIYFEPVWKIHPAYRELILYPPEGYEFIVQEGLAENIFERVAKARFAYQLTNGMYKLAPLTLIKSYLDGFLRKRPNGVDLTYSVWHLVFRKEPWVIEVGSAADPVGLYMKHLKKYRRLVESVLASEYCKKILPWTEFTKKEILTNLDCAELEQKIEVAPRAVCRKDFTKSYDRDKVKALFIGSASIAGGFEARGGKEVLEAFNILCQKYKNLELVIKSDIPQSIKGKYHQHLANPRITVIEEIISWQQLEEIYKSVDIFLFPGHYNAWLVILEAMSYELPVIATDENANPEQVKHNKTGFIISKYEKVTSHQEGSIPVEPRSEFMKAIKIVDPKVVQQLVEKTSILIENPELRRNMGKAGRWEVEQGKFSIENRNKKLKKIFDEAIASSEP